MVEGVAKTNWRGFPYLHFLTKLAAIEMLFGGPLVASDDLRPVIGKTAAIIVGCVPSILFCVGADALADPKTARHRRTFIRVGVFGVSLAAPMNAYALWRVVEGDVRFGAITVVGLLACTLVIFVYGFLARRALKDSPPAPDANVGGIVDDTPIE